MSLKLFDLYKLMLDVTLLYRVQHARDVARQNIKDLNAKIEEAREETERAEEEFKEKCGEGLQGELSSLKSEILENLEFIEEKQFEIMLYEEALKYTEGLRKKLRRSLSKLVRELIGVETRTVDSLVLRTIGSLSIDYFEERFWLALKKLELLRLAVESGIFDPNTTLKEMDRREMELREKLMKELRAEDIELLSVAVGFGDFGIEVHNAYEPLGTVFLSSEKLIDGLINAVKERRWKLEKVKINEKVYFSEAHMSEEEIENPEFREALEEALKNGVITQDEFSELLHYKMSPFERSSRPVKKFEIRRIKGFTFNEIYSVPLEFGKLWAKARVLKSEKAGCLIEVKVVYSSGWSEEFYFLTRRCREETIRDLFELVANEKKR